MMNVLIVVGVIYILATLFLFGIDIYYYMIDRYSRFHIGRYPDEKKWRDRVIKKGIAWITHTPTVKITDNNRYLLIDMLTGKYRSNVIQSWQKGALLLGLEEHGKTYETEIQEGVNGLITPEGNFYKNPTAVDGGLLAYSILQASDPKKVKPAMDYTANLITALKGSDGMIAYTNITNSKERYVDAIGLGIPFLFLYANKYNKPEYAELGMEQLKKFTEYGLDSKSLLPNHAFDVDTKLPLGVYGWGRGCAWYCIGLIDSYKVATNLEHIDWIREQILTIAEAYSKYQKTDGGFSYIVQMQGGYDSSVTAVMAYFYRECSKIFANENYYYIYVKCMDKLKSVTRITGALDWCQGDTKGIGVFSQTYGIMPFAQGFLIRAFEED